MNLRTRRRFVIVGGGASGTLLASQVLRQATEPLDVMLVEPGQVGRGLAYGTPHPEHLLNVRSGRMSALPDDAGHFVQWLEATGRPSSPEGYVDRATYGAYMEAVLDESVRAAPPNVRLYRVKDAATSIADLGLEAVVRLGSGKSLAAERVAVALGNLSGPGPLPALEGHPGYVSDPWAPGALDAIGPRDGVVIVGTGLTMVDVALVLAARGHEATICAVSRRGLLPRAHGVLPLAALSPSPRGGVPTLREWMRWVRNRESGRASDARTNVDALRPVTPALWRRLSDADQRRFLRHVRPYWDVHRHRMAPSVAARVDELLRSHRLWPMPARLVRAHPTAEGGIDLHVVARGTSTAVTLGARFVVNATGPELDVTRARSSLLQQMLAGRLVRPDRLRLGLDATHDGALLDDEGRASSVLYTLGPLLRGVHWESVAVPEIRQQAAALASRWLAEAASVRRVDPAIA